MREQGLIAALVMLALGTVMIVFRRRLGGLSRFRLMSPPELRGWGYWEKLIPNERVAWALGEMYVFLAGCLLIIVGAVGLVLTLLGHK